MQESPQQAQARAAIQPIKDAIEDELLAKSGVVAVDIAPKETKGETTDELSIVVFVEEKKPKSKVGKSDLVPAEIDGIKTDVQEYQVELQISQAAKLVDGELLVDAATYTTIEGGISMGPNRTVFLSPPDVPAPGNYVFVGTLGAMVKDRVTDAPMALTNFHVACVNNTWTVGDVMVQPSKVDNAAAATRFGTLTRAEISADVDAAVISLDAGKAWEPHIVDIGDVAGSTPATVGMPVQKRGRTTEHTFGTVVSTSFTVTLNYGSDVGSVTLRNQIRIQTDTTRSTRFSDRGDSGSVVVDNNRNVVGLLFGGTLDGSFTFANPIQTVLDRLNVNIAVPPAWEVTRPVISCLLTRSEIICDFVTRQAQDCFVITRKTDDCFIATRKTVDCFVTRNVVDCFVTRNVEDCFVTRTGVDCFEVTRPTCPPVTRRCPEWPDLTAPPELGGPGGRGFGGGQGAWLAGYLTALEEIAEAEAAEDEAPGAGG